MDQNKLRFHRLRLFLFGLLLLLVMLLIFYMSGQSGCDSQFMSDEFMETFLGRVLTRILPKLTESVSTSIRKYAHIFEFFCLGASSFLFFHELFWMKSRRLVRSFPAAFLWSFLYACSDEWHQTFVPDRSGSPSDLRFDAAGILLGIALMCGVLYVCRRKRRQAVNKI